MKSWFSWKELLGCPGMPQGKRNLLLRAQKQSWETRLTPVRGGQLKEFFIDSLPTETQAYLHSIYKEQNGSPEPNNDDRAGDSGDNRLDPSPIYGPTAVEHTELVGQQIAQAPEQPAPAVVKPQREPRVGRPKGSKGDAKIDGWLAIIRAWEEYQLQHAQEPVVECEYAFAKAYQQQEIALPESIYEAIPKISRATLCRKRIELRKGVTALAGKEGAGRPK